MHTTLRLFSISLLLFSFRQGMSQQCDVHPPKDLFVTNITSCSAMLHWSPATTASEYKVRFKPQSEEDWSPNVSVGLDTFYNFTGLEKDSSYTLSVRAFCDDGTKSELIRVTISTTPCTLPSIVTVQPVNSTASRITISSTCPFDTIYYRYALSGQSLMLYHTTDPNAILLHGLTEGLKYKYQVSTCPLSMNSWTTAKAFTFHKPDKPNVLLILMDDSRFDFYSCNGAPSFFKTPNIDRIANEGVNFKNNYTVYSLCAPSRSSIVTGLYSSRTHVISNITSNNLNPDLPTIFEVLHNNGYYTGLYGKNQDMFSYADGSFDYWLACLTLGDDDFEKKYSYLNDTVYLEGYLTDVLTDSAMNSIGSSTQPFFLWLAYGATHTPLVPKPEYDGQYDNAPLPLKSDTPAYTHNYPSYLYTLGDRNYAVGQDLLDLYSDSYSVMKDVDDNVGRLLESLEACGKLDNTMIIFTSDNGHLFGEHHMNMKRLAYDPSIHTPLFIRYPKWFPSNTFVTNQISLNIDLAPTILGVAEVGTGFISDGMSVNKLYKNQKSRKEFYYHSFYTSENQYQNLPYAQAIRDFNYKYIYYGCESDTTEEFFDLVNDPLEKVNQINNPQFNALIQGYRIKVSTYSAQYGEPQEDTVVNCYLANAPVLRTNNLNNSTTSYSIYPNPSNGQIVVTSHAGSIVHFEITDAFGRICYESDISEGDNVLPLSFLPQGSYTASFFSSSSTAHKQFVIQ